MESNDEITLGVIFLLFGAISVAVGVGAGMTGFGRVQDEQATPNLVDRCAPGHTGNCFSRRPGSIVSINSHDARYVVVGYDDGRKSEDVVVKGDWKPETGMAVTLERWRGNTLALSDPSSGRHYRTSAWPQGWPGVVKGLLLIGVALALVPFGIAFAIAGLAFAALAGEPAIRRLIRGRRRAPPSSSSRGR